jgi:hypothetical protein
MAEKNEAFFTFCQNMFLNLKEDPEIGEEKALELMGKTLEMGLKEAYDATGFQKGNPKDFERVLRARDESVGLRVEFPEVTDNKIIYQFHDDPFPGLKGEVDPGKLDATYMAFKVSYLLGNDWGYTTTKHKWRGDDFTEHVIERKA